MGLPKIIINFIQKAATAIRRSEKGIVCLILRDETEGPLLTKANYIAQVSDKEWTASNYRIIRDTFLEGPSTVYIVRVGAEENLNDIKATVDSLKFNWIAFADADGQSDVVDYIKERNGKCKFRKIKAVVFNATNPDDPHIVNLVNETVTKKEDGAVIQGYLYVGRIAGILAALPFTRSSTFFLLDDLSSVEEPEDVDEAIDDGGFVLINDYGEPKVGRGVNSLKEPKENQTEDWKSITIIEAMDLMLEDIYSSFKSDYIGKYKNKYANQCIFISAINRYMEALAKEDVLDPEFDNHADVNVEAQRTAWLGAGKEEAATWDEQTVKKNTFKRQVFLAGNVKILDAMEDLQFDITVM